jgi:Rps23 Pro-64 3,4-dihydroxylase Tpa1-like proline 4-hydroxylase
MECLRQPGLVSSAAALRESREPDHQESKGKVLNYLDLRLLQDAFTQRLFGLEASQWLRSYETARQPATPIVVFDEFLVSEELTGLLDYTLTHSNYFTGTRVISREGEGVIDRANRRSRVLMAWSPFHELLANRIGTFFPVVLEKLGWPSFQVGHIETQLTASNHEEFFKTHSDNANVAVRTRELTFVYFFYREPKAFSGGELIVYDTVVKDGYHTPVGPFQVIHPRQNQIVFFPSYCLHEVTTIGCPSRAFADSRFTLNGWLHQ